MTSAPLDPATLARVAEWLDTCAERSEDLARLASELGAPAAAAPAHVALDRRRLAAALRGGPETMARLAAPLGAEDD